MESDILTVDTADGVSVGTALKILGLETAYIGTVDSPNTITHKFDLRDIMQESKLKKFASALSMVAHTPVNIVRGLMDAHFGVELLKHERVAQRLTDFLPKIKKGEVALGVDNNNGVVAYPLTDCPHLLVAGATGSGKSVMLNSIICSLMATHKPAELSFAMIDKKQVELTAYTGSPFLRYPVATNSLSAVNILYRLNLEMDKRYAEMRKSGLKRWQGDTIVLVVDELADLTENTAYNENNELERLARMGRASGIHLVLATQRPTVKVCNGAIKANIPTRIALHTVSVRDSMNIIDGKGAEALADKGDALVKFPDRSALTRFQGFYVSPDEINEIATGKTRKENK